MFCERTKDIKVLSVSCSDKDRYLPPDRAAIDAMKKSLTEFGQINPIGVHPVTHSTYRLIVGATRFRAAAELGWDTIRASIWTGSAIDFQLYELTENVDRRELTAETRREMRAKIRALQREKLANVKVKASKGGRGYRGGIAEAARQVGVPRSTARRRQYDTKPVHNIKSGQVSEQTDSPNAPDKQLEEVRSHVRCENASQQYATRKFTLDFQIGEFRVLEEYCQRNNVSIAAAIRQFVREGIRRSIAAVEKSA